VLTRRRRPIAVPAPAAAAPELSDRPRRRTFTVQDKLRVLARAHTTALPVRSSARMLAQRSSARFGGRCLTGRVLVFKDGGGTPRHVEV
jgi:hypothetical protein